MVENRGLIGEDDVEEGTGIVGVTSLSNLKEIGNPLNLSGEIKDLNNLSNLSKLKSVGDPLDLPIDAANNSNEFGSIQKLKEIEHAKKVKGFPYMLSIYNKLSYAIKDPTVILGLREDLFNVLKRGNIEEFDALTITLESKYADYSKIKVSLMPELYALVEIHNRNEQTGIFDQDFLNNLDSIMFFIENSLGMIKRHKLSLLEDELSKDDYDQSHEGLASLTKQVFKDTKGIEARDSLRATAKKLTTELETNGKEKDTWRGQIFVDKIGSNFYSVESYGESTVIDTTNNSVLHMGVDFIGLLGYGELLGLANLVNFIKFHYINGKFARNTSGLFYIENNSLKINVESKLGGKSILISSTGGVTILDDFFANFPSFLVDNMSKGGTLNRVGSDLDSKLNLFIAYLNSLLLEKDMSDNAAGTD